MVVFNRSFVCFAVLVLLQNAGFLWGANVTLSISPLDNGFLGTQLEIHCDLNLGTEFMLPRRLEYFRKRPNQPEEEIVRAKVEINSTHEWTDTNLSQRSNLQFSSQTSATLTINRIECDDTAIYSCRYFTSDFIMDTYVYSSNNVFQVTGVTGNLKITGGIGCDSFEADSSTCTQCLLLGTDSRHIYARMNEEVMLTCTGDLGLNASRNIFQWYKTVRTDRQQHPIFMNITNDILPEYPPGVCTVRASSTLRYYPTSEDEGLQIFCKVAVSSLHSSIVSTNVSVCVQGTTNVVSAGCPSYQSLNVGISMLPLLGCFVGSLKIQNLLLV